MNLQNKIITIFGGTGFVGRYIVARLAKQGATIKIATRSTSSGYFLRQFGVVGQIVPVACDYSEHAINQAVSGSDIVINCLGVLFEKGKSKFGWRTIRMRLKSDKQIIMNHKKIIRIKKKYRHAPRGGTKGEKWL